MVVVTVAAVVVVVAVVVVIRRQPCSAAVALKAIGDASSLRGSDDSHALQQWC